VIDLHAYNLLSPMALAAKLSSDRLADFRRSLLSWYSQNKRDLPWRKTSDPYRIWISEIMLQQTRVAAVIEHYAEFLKRFPSLERLAAVRESSVLAAWSGLGYYRRARNLHAAAKRIVEQQDGVFPQESESWRALPGIGRYTASAIASIAFGKPAAVLDGNVERVLHRLLGQKGTNRNLWIVAQDLLDRDHPGDFNQAMMELGATVCSPQQPQCSLCPIRKFCRTQGRGSARLCPIPQQQREIAYRLERRANFIRLVFRPKRARLMPKMWELPEAVSKKASDKLLFSLSHSITVTNFKVRVISRKTRCPNGRWVRTSRLRGLPLTGLARKILRTAKLIQ
jgi:A/G-specific adenine glycosylase